MLGLIHVDFPYPGPPAGTTAPPTIAPAPAGTAHSGVLELVLALALIVAVGAVITGLRALLRLHGEVGRLEREVRRLEEQRDAATERAAVPAIDRRTPGWHRAAALPSSWDGPAPHAGAAHSDMRPVRAAVRAVLEPRGLIEVDGVLHPALWEGPGPAPRRGTVLARPPLADDFWHAFSPPRETSDAGLRNRRERELP